MVKPGYKQTEIGVIPEDWDCVRLGEKAKIYRGGSPRPIQDYITTSSDGANWIKIGDVRQNDKYIRSTQEKITPEGISKSREVHIGDFILSNSMSFGRPYILDIDGCIHDGWLTIQDYKNTFSTEYLYYLLSSDLVYQQYIGMAAGSSVKNLNKDKVSALYVIYSAVSEQERIAKALSDVDELISSLEKLIEKYKSIKATCLQQMFPQKGETTPKMRLPGFTGAWEQRKLSEMCGTFEYGLNAAAKEFDGKNKYIRITDIDDASREFLLSDLSSPAIFLDGMSKYLLSSGDIVFARTGASVGKTYIYRENDGIVYFAGFLIRAKVNQNNDAEFVFQSTLSPSYEKYIRITSQRSGQPGVNAQEYGEYDLFAPSKEEQQRIGHFLRGIDNLITLHQRKLDKAKKIKQGMMQQLLTGKIRLNN